MQEALDSNCTLCLMNLTWCALGARLGVAGAGWLAGRLAGWLAGRPCAKQQQRPVSAAVAGCRLCLRS
jgi:hypothetical protein